MEWVMPALAVLCLFSLFVSAVAVLWAAQVKIDMEAFKKSTHQVQFVPLEEPKTGQADDDGTMSQSMEDMEDEAYSNVNKIHDRRSKQMGGEV